MATVHLLHGLPGTGKTAYARKLARERHAFLLNHDEIMVARHGANPPLADFARFAADISEELWTRTGQLVRQEQEVILDWGFWTRASRDEARARVAAAGGKGLLYRMVCPDAVARERALQRSQSDPAGGLRINAAAWDSFRMKFEPLADDEERRDVVTTP